MENAVAYGKRARVALEPTGDAFGIVIDDDGPGIPEADFERVFAPFVRLEESRSRETGGIGLGMAIARSIARGHGGDITLANRAERRPARDHPSASGRSKIMPGSSLPIAIRLGVLICSRSIPTGSQPVLPAADARRLARGGRPRLFRHADQTPGAGGEDQAVALGIEPQGDALGVAAATCRPIWSEPTVA